jgi:hypothetical protein
VTAATIYVLAPRPKKPAPDAEAWDRTAQEAFTDLVQQTRTLINNPRDATGVERALAAFRNTRTRVEQLDTPSAFQPTRKLYVAAVSLYVEAARVYQADVGQTEPGQLDLVARRLRELGDRVFDRGRALLGIKPQADTPDIDVNLPEDVPLWTAEGLAAGPPLDDPSPPAAADPPLRPASRPEQSRAAWDRDVTRARAPRAAELHTTDVTRLRDVARRYVAAAEFLRARPDPKNGREECARLRLSWLVAADAARAAQTGLVDVAGQLERTAAMIWP